jgi:hypothetical protein
MFGIFTEHEFKELRDLRKLQAIGLTIAWAMCTMLIPGIAEAQEPQFNVQASYFFDAPHQKTTIQSQHADASTGRYVDCSNCVKLRVVHKHGRSFLKSSLPASEYVNFASYTYRSRDGQNSFSQDSWQIEQAVPLATTIRVGHRLIPMRLTYANIAGFDSDYPVINYQDCLKGCGK